MSPSCPAGLCYVTHVSMTTIHLSGANRHWRKYLRAAGLPASWWADGVPYTRRHEHDESDCERIMLALAQLGVSFAEDYKQGMAPADIMRDLQQRGVLRTPFVAVSWNGPGKDRRRVVPPPRLSQ